MASFFMTRTICSNVFWNWSKLKRKSERCRDIEDGIRQEISRDLNIPLTKIFSQKKKIKLANLSISAVVREKFFLNGGIMCLKYFSLKCWKNSKGLLQNTGSHKGLQEEKHILEKSRKLIYLFLYDSCSSDISDFNQKCITKFYEMTVHELQEYIIFISKYFTTCVFRYLLLFTEDLL